MDGGFLDHLLKVKERLSVRPLRFGLAIDPDVVLHRRHFRIIGTKAFIRRATRPVLETNMNSRTFPRGSVWHYDRAHARRGRPGSLLYSLFTVPR